MRNFLTLFIILFLLVSCGNVGKALRNEKSKSTDEFLIEKRAPLSIPPKMGELPKPRSKSEIKKNKSSILEAVVEEENPGKKSELENIFLEEIRKN